MMACEICKKPYIPPSDDNSFSFDKKPHLCNICGQSFALKVQLKRHLLSHEGDVPYVCSSCENQSSSYNLRLSKKGNFVCETCNKCFNTKRSLLRHAGEHTMENILNCDECGESFKNMTALKRHIAIHKPNKSHLRNNRKNTSEMYQCQECGKFFARLKQYEAHCLNHKKYQCSECNVYFASNKLLQEHLSSGSCHSRSETSLDSFNSNTVTESKKHECSICDKSFTRKSALEGHMVSHFMEDNHESPTEDQDDSDKDMDFQYNLKDEKSNELCLPKPKVRRLFSCEKCSLVFSSKIQLNKHMLSHNNKPENPVPRIEMVTTEYHKTYTCRICQQTFDLKENYKQHKLSHNTIETNKEEKSYTCQICLKVFGRKKHLKKHVRSHLDDTTDDSNISKNPIEENGTDKSNSQDDITLFSGKKEKRAKNFPCHFCGKLFAGETCLKKHEAKHDKDEEQYKEIVGKGRKGKKAKPLICEYCNEDFTGKRHVFIKHRLNHTPEVCGICDSRFTDRASLREHCKIHIGTEEGERFLQCSQKVLDAKNGVAQPEAKVEYIYLVLR